MNCFNRSIFLVFAGLLFSFFSCETKKKPVQPTAFTYTDSLTDIYLTLQDSMLLVWNTMINDDNQKLKAMNNLLHELQVGGEFDPEKIRSMRQRIEQLWRIRYTAKTMWNADVVTEYDFASSSVVAELISLAESHTAFNYNKILQDLVEEIRAADLRVENYRVEYDAVASRYNRFLDENKDHLSEITDHGPIAKKALFQTASEDSDTTPR